MNPANSSSRGPDFIVIGAMKCMTSTLHEQLAAQPGVFMTTPKEPNYFSNDDVYARGEGWYRSLFSESQEHDLCGESSTHYSKLPTYPETVERMRTAFPQVKLVYVMRHPVDRLVSQYVHEWTERRVSCSINEAVDDLPEMVDYSRYAYQLAPYLRTFGPENVLPVFFERLRATPQSEMERIADFLGCGLKFVWNSDCEVQNQSDQRLRTSWLRDAIVYAPGVSWLRRTLVPKNIRNRVKSFWKLPTEPTLSKQVEAQLVDVFNRDLQVLGDWLDVDLTCDRFREVTSQFLPRWRCDLSEKLAEEVTRQEALA
ncbi:sulfotransferase family protein [Aeoliella sp.]|uniref:sulfotransferase family protein n=1 Tax=Aeoliella sp. TaxID=2795800 RepID=UPI003CCB8B8D